MQKLQTVNLLGVPITSESKDNILKYILEHVEKRGKQPALGEAGLKVFTPNPEIIMYCQKHPEFKKILVEADVNLPDGVGILWAAKKLGLSLDNRITGVDLMEDICKALSEENLVRGKNKKKPYSVGFFGGRGNVAKRASECLQKKYSGLQISYATSEWDEAQFGKKEADVLFVAMGFPRQEEWISEHLKNLPAGRQVPVRVAMGVGGAFDFFSGKTPRAPKLLRTIGLEWLFRLMVQPWRWKRQLQLLAYIRLINREKRNR